MTTSISERYSRQIILPEIGIPGQEKIRKARVLIIGAGGLGCFVIQCLTTAGVGTLGIMDYDIVEESNLSRQPLYSFQDIGKPKAIQAATKAREINSECVIEVIFDKLTLENAATIFSKYDMVADCSDNFSTRYIISDASILTKIPTVLGAIEGWVGQISVFNYLYGPTYRDLFPDYDSSAANCNEKGVAPTLPAVIGSLQANEILKIILNAEDTLSGRLMVLDLWQHTTNYFTIQKISQPEFIEIEISKEAGENGNFEMIDIRAAEDIFDPIPYKNIPYFELDAAKLSENIQYLLICETGLKSKIMAKKLRRERKELKIFSLKGGLKSIF